MKRTFLTIAAVVALVALAAAPAFAEGYNNGGWNFATEVNEAGYADNAGIYVREPAAGSDQEQSFTGPHGGYTTTTNKCQDCHSTHYATGSYKLLRANSAASACDFCHGGGGGSSVNIMMDNEYRAQGDVNIAEDGVAIVANDTGKGTGHTLGYKGNAPADIDPAFSDPTDGLACFSCHTPHGNSARVLQAFGSPARPAGDGYVTKIAGVSFMNSEMYRIQESMKVDLGTGQGAPAGAGIMPDDLALLPGATKYDNSAVPVEIGAYVRTLAETATTMAAFNVWVGGLDGNPSTPDNVLPPTSAQMFTWATTPGNIVPDTNGDGYNELTPGGFGALMGLFMPGGTNQLTNLFGSWNVYWGQDIKEGNVATCFINMGDWQVGGNNFDMTPAADNYGVKAMPELEVWHKPLFPKGRFLLLKNPDSGDDRAASTVNDMNIPGSVDFAIGQVGDGTSAGNDGGKAAKKVAIDWEWPIGPAASWGPFFSTNGNERFPLHFPWAPKGVAMENEMCTSCHDGAAGMSKEGASVWHPNSATTTDLDGEYIMAYSHDSNARGCARAQYLNTDDDNNFGPHCANCHTGSSGCRTCHSEEGQNWESFGRDAYDPTETGFVEGVTSYKAPAAVRTRAVANINGKCLDGGFSYPHRTLGANMLKDNLWGVDFDGTEVKAGEARQNNGDTNVANYNAESTDLQSFFTTGESFESSSVIGTTAGQVAHNLDSVCIDCHGDATYYNEDAYTEFTSYNPLAPSQSWGVTGWNLLLKGLP